MQLASSFDSVGCSFAEGAEARSPNLNHQHVFEPADLRGVLRHSQVTKDVPFSVRHQNLLLLNLESLQAVFLEFVQFYKAFRLCTRIESCKGA